eukprot:CAMPEP_0183758152 /NCGR_PEP_ID=MMETSP0739-20130205/6224_1 /TAXON_ID=385413 /ORGANISM="Thalassiosira miniscula, Strain CCMP1093" /LENGTH=352 /DNA_ID=CAMNT_0025995705 /DNA_START=64 /DNA_END=1122 /DNA_ORIENTATION=-
MELPAGYPLSRFFLALSLFGIVAVLSHDGATTVNSTAPLNLRGDIVAVSNTDVIGTRKEDQCLSLDSSLRQLINSTDQVFLLAPPKAAGTTMNWFASECTNGVHPGHVLQKPDELEALLTNSYELPKVVSSHVLKYHQVVHLIKHVPRNTLMIYVHRPETSRVTSAINWVVIGRACRCATKGVCGGANGQDPMPVEFEKIEGDDCYVKEDKLVDLIKSRKNEINDGASKLLTCETFEAIEDYAPNMVFMDYKQANNLQHLLAEKYCPQMSETVEANVASKKQNQVFVITKEAVNKKGDHTVNLEEWTKTKTNYLEMSLQLNERATCVAKGRAMEDKLYSCKDNFLHSKALLD